MSAPRRTLAATLVALSLVAPYAHAAFTLIESPTATPAPYSPPPVAVSRGDSERMQQEVARLNKELNALKAQLVAAQLDATNSRKELLAIRAQNEGGKANTPLATTPYAPVYFGPKKTQEVASKPSQVEANIQPQLQKVALPASATKNEAVSKSLPPPVAPAQPVTASVQAAAKPAAAVVAAPAPPANKALPVVWESQKGSTLRSTVTQWAKTANWTVDWRPEDLNYEVPDLRIEGTFEDAVIKIFSYYRNADRPFQLKGSRQQKLIRVLEKTNPRKSA